MKRVSFFTLGCKLNYAETSSVAERLRRHGYQIVPFEEEADISIINTCSVTENADKRLKEIVRNYRKKNKNGRTIATGCYAQLRPKEVAETTGVDLVLGSQEKFDIIKHLDQIETYTSTQCYVSDVYNHNSFHQAFSSEGRTRSFLKVQDGCDYTCTYCTIPQARGVSRSDTLANIIKQAKKISEQGYKEIVLTGVNVGDYGKGEFGNKKHEHTFLDLLRALEDSDLGVRFRISSIEPNLLTEDIISFVASSPSFMPHFHVPLQSGSDSILKKMQRRYLTALYKARVEKIKSLMPNACIGADIIVGFPAETEVEFEDTYEFIQELDVSYLHVFSFSSRPNTKAAEMTSHIASKEKQKRSRMLRILSDKKKEAFYRSQAGTKQNTLFENENKEGYIYGWTENYVRTKQHWDPALANTVQEVTLRNIDDPKALFGELIPKDEVVVL